MTDLKLINKKCVQIIKDKLLNGNESSEWEACKIFAKLVDDVEKEHNCLGCQFVDLHQEIYENFSELDVSNLSNEFYFKTYVFWLYQNEERIYEIFELINPSGSNPLIKTFFEKNFVVLKQIKKWVNFIKHPKAFQFSHHPIYIFEIDKSSIPKDSIVFDTKEIEKYYSGDKNNNELYNRISNKKNVYIIMPDIEKMTSLFCDEFKIFTSWICNNEMIVEFLKQKSTIANYFNELDEN